MSQKKKISLADFQDQLRNNNQQRIAHRKRMSNALMSVLIADEDAEEERYYARDMGVDY